MRVKRGARLAGLCLAAVVGAAACGGSASPATPFPSLGANAVVFTAKGTQFTTTSVHVPADTPWTLALDNQDGLPHNVVIIDKDNSTVFTSSTVVGPALRTDAAPALSAGVYRFMCSVHPAMQGTITVP